MMILLVTVEETAEEMEARNALFERLNDGLDRGSYN